MNLKPLIHLARPSAPRMLVNFFIGLLQVAASLMFVWSSKALVDIVTGEREMNIYLGVALMLGTMLVQIACRVGSAWWDQYNSARTRNELRHSIFERVLGSRWSGKERFHSADAVNRLEEDIRVVTELFCTRIPGFLVSAVQMVAASIFLVVMAPDLWWVLVTLTVVALLGARLFFRKVRALTAQLRSNDSRLQQHIQEHLSFRVLALMIFGPSKVMEGLDDLQAQQLKITLERMNYSAVSRTFMGLGFTGGYAAAFLWGIFGIRSGAVTYGMMTAFLQLVSQVQRPIADMGSSVPAFIHALTSVDRLWELYSLEQEDSVAEDSLSAMPGVRFEDVSFSYGPDGAKVLSGVSFDCKPGTLMALAGPTGIGKSTILRLAMGLLRPDSGRIVLYDGNAEAAPSAGTRHHFQYVPQGNTLLAGTIRENLLMANPSASEEMLLEALRTAEAGFVQDLPEGLDTRCGEIGAGLSEGQSQRIAIARALLHPGGILVLDEASSALDADTEKRLLDNLSKAYSGKKTIIFVSHREAVARIADYSFSLQ